MRISYLDRVLLHDFGRAAWLAGVMRIGAVLFLKVVMLVLDPTTIYKYGSGGSGGERCMTHLGGPAFDF